MSWTLDSIREHLEVRISEINAHLTNDHNIFFTGGCCDALKDRVEASLYSGFWKARIVRSDKLGSFTVVVMENNQDRLNRHDDVERVRRFRLSLLQQE